MTELQKLDAAVKDQVTMEVQCVERLIAGKMKKDQYVEMESNLKSKKEDLYQKMEALLSSL